MITGRQIRAARSLLDWDAEDLAERSSLSRDTVFNIEKGVVQARGGSIEKIVQAFAQEGVEFIDQSGVRRKDDTLRIVDGEDSYLQLLDDVFYTLKNGGEALFAYICNGISSKAAIESQLRMRRSGITFRSLIAAGDNYCLYPLDEYRQIPSHFFENNAQVIYGDKVGSMIDGNKKALIVRNASFAETQRRAFNLIWSLHAAPQKTISKEKYE